MITQEKDIYSNREHGAYVFYAVQGEANERQLLLNLFDENGQEVNVSSATALMYVIKPDRNVAVIECETGDANTVTCLLTYQAGTYAGQCNMILQLLVDGGELRYDSMVLSVAASVDNYISQSDLGPIATVLNNASRIEALYGTSQQTEALLEAAYTEYEGKDETIQLTLENSKAILAVMESILAEYSGELSAEYGGKLYEGSDENILSGIAYDSAGNLLYVNEYITGAPGSMLSVDNGKTWKSVEIMNTALTTFTVGTVVGGPRFLFLSRDGDKGRWGVVNGDSLTVGSTFDTGFSISISPAIRYGRYVNGKYLYFSADSGARRSVYCVTWNDDISSAAFSTFLPPAEAGRPDDVIYDAQNGVYYIVTTLDKTSIGACEARLYLAEDLETASSWELLETWEETDEHKNYSDPSHSLSLRNGCVNIYCNYSSPVNVYSYRIDTGELSSQAISGSNSMYGGPVVSSPVVDVFPSARYGGTDYDVWRLVSTKDGENFSVFGVSSQWTTRQSQMAAAASNRYIAMCWGAYYAVYRVDMIGENISNEWAEIKPQALAATEAANTAAEYANTQGAAAERIVEKWKDTSVGALAEELDSHENSAVTSEEGIHGLRYYENKLQIKDESGEWKPAAQYKYYGVKIVTDGDPYLTYIGDAEGMNAGWEAWKNTALFSKVKPCLRIATTGSVEYLNPDDFSEDEHGNAIYEQLYRQEYDLMIEIPKMGYKFSDDGKEIYITDDPSAEGYCYRAHGLDNEGDCDYIYVGAYLASLLPNTTNKLTSRGNATVAYNTTVSHLRDYCQNRGDGFQPYSFYVLTLLQCIYTLIFKDRNGQRAIGMGYTASANSEPITTTGAMDKKGMCYGESTGTEQMKFLGMEDFWGNFWQFTDGVYLDANSNVLTDFSNFSNTGSGYRYSKAIAFPTSGGFVKAVQGTTEAGFVVKTSGASSSTYWCDNGSAVKSSNLYFGNNWKTGLYAGPYCMCLASSFASSMGYFTTRVVYKHKAG